MANEIWHSYQDGNTLYALIWRQTDDQIYDVVAAANTFEAYADANIDNYDLPMTAAGTTGDYYSVDFPADITVGIYRVTVMLQAGASPHVDNDNAIAQGEIYWDGSSEINEYTIESDLDVLISDINVNESAIDVIKSDLTIVDSHLDYVLSDMQSDLNTAISNLDYVIQLEQLQYNDFGDGTGGGQGSDGSTADFGSAGGSGC